MRRGYLFLHPSTSFMEQLWSLIYYLLGRRRRHFACTLCDDSSAPDRVITSDNNMGTDFDPMRVSGLP